MGGGCKKENEKVKNERKRRPLRLKRTATRQEKARRKRRWKRC